MDMVSTKSLVLLILGIFSFHFTTAARNVTDEPPDGVEPARETTETKELPSVISPGGDVKEEEKGYTDSTIFTTISGVAGRNHSDDSLILDKNTTTKHVEQTKTESFEKRNSSIERTDIVPPSAANITSGLQLINFTKGTSEAEIDKIKSDSTAVYTREDGDNHNGTHANRTVHVSANFSVSEPVSAKNKTDGVNSENIADKAKLRHQYKDVNVETLSPLTLTDNDTDSVFAANTMSSTQLGKGTLAYRDNDQTEESSTTATAIISYTTNFKNTTQAISEPVSDSVASNETSPFDYKKEGTVTIQFPEGVTRAAKNGTVVLPNATHTSVISSEECSNDSNLNKSLCRNNSRTQHTLEINVTVTEETISRDKNGSLLSRLLFNTSENETVSGHLTDFQPMRQKESGNVVNSNDSLIDNMTRASTTTLSPPQTSPRTTPLHGNDKPVVVTFKLDDDHHYNAMVQTMLLEGLKHGTWENQVPIEDGPFGSLIWRDKKYLISVLVPIGVGITGAVVIVVVAYVVRSYKRKKKRRAFTSPSRIFRPQAQLAIMDQVLLLDDSSDDEF